MPEHILPFEAAIDQLIHQKWLVLGKGPTSSLFKPAMADEFPVIALNHAMRGIKAKIGHAIDIEVFDDIKIQDLQDIEYLCVPWIPHVRLWKPLYPGKAYFGPGNDNLLEHCRRKPILKFFLRNGRLLSYNLCTAPRDKHHHNFITVEARTFSAAVAVSLLAQSGCRKIRTLGVDGGSDYGPAYTDIASTRKLQTAQTSFDKQFIEIAAVIQKFQLDCGPMNHLVPARIFVGCMPEQDLAYRVLEYSIHRHSSISVQVDRLHEALAVQNIEVPQPQDPSSRGRTPFSFQRFVIPRLCDYKGRAIYLDSDMLVLRDIRSLWTKAMASAPLISAEAPPASKLPPQFSVMLLNCEQLRWDIASIVDSLNRKEISYSELMYEMAAAPGWTADLSWHWNSLEQYIPESTCLIHFTNMNGQPWLNPLHPHGALWCRYLLDAVAEGRITVNEVATNVRNGHVRPSLLYQVENGQPEPLKLPFSVLAGDTISFLPVHLRDTNIRNRLRFEARRSLRILQHEYKRTLIDPLRINALKLSALIRKRLNS